MWRDVLTKLEETFPIKGKREEKAFNIITKFLDGFEIQEFRNVIPNCNSVLYCDNTKIESMGCSFISGKISGKDNILSSITEIEPMEMEGIIVFNPYSESISLPNFYKKPALAISKNQLENILNAESVYGFVRVKKEKFKSRNILVGNLDNPKQVVISHYDTILNGVIDNTLAISLLIDIITNFPKVLKNNLFVFSGSEELSYDDPYWGYGYRVFEEEYNDILNKCKRILVIDIVGFSDPVLHRNKKFLIEAFPILNKKLYKKTIMLSGNIKDIRNLWKIYHSLDDTSKNLNTKIVEKTKNKLIKILL